MDSDASEVDYAAFIGLDWGSEKHSVAFQAAGSKEIETYELKQTPEELHGWLIGLRDRFGGRPVAVAIEQTKGAVIHALLGYDFVHVFRINPLSLSSYRKAFSPGGAKDDAPDADLLIEWVKLHRDRIKPWVPDDAWRRLRNDSRVRPTGAISAVSIFSLVQDFKGARRRTDPRSRRHSARGRTSARRW